MKDKLNIIFKPYFLILVGLTIGYTLLNWILFIQLNLFSLREIVTSLVIPFVLTASAAWLYLKPKLKILRLDAKRGNWRDFYTFILWIFLSIPLIVAQQYIVTATGRLTELSSVREINKFPPTKYYKLSTYFINKKAIGVHSAFEVGGRYNENFSMYIYVVMPIFESEGDASSTEPLGWLGIRYSKKISNRLEPNEKEAEYQQFANDSQKDFDLKNVSDFTYLERLGNSDDRDGYISAIHKNTVYKPNGIILIGINEPFEARNGRKLQFLLGSALIGSLIVFIMLLIPKINSRELQRIKAGLPDKSAQRNMHEFLGFLKPRGGYFITPILIYINIGIFLLMVLSGMGLVNFKINDLLNWGADYRPLVRNGEWWRLLSNIFLHGGLMHLLANMYGLLFVGIFLEPILGRLKYLMIYLLLGILASIASICWYDATVSVGASGAIFGLYGVFLALLLTRIYPPDFAKSFLISTSFFIGYNLLMGLAGGIDNAAHIGGLLGGFVTGMVLYPTFKQKSGSYTSHSK